jgi:hypothetical protein
LAAIITPVVMQSLTKARNAAIKAEIDMLHMAIMNYKSEYGSFPPCFDSLTLSGTGPVGRHITRTFPRCTSGSAASQLVNLLNPVGGPAKNPTFIVPTNAISFWLSGYTADPQLPLSPPGSRQKLFDFDVSRVDPVAGVYFPSGKPGSPYVYINRSQYGSSWPPAAFSYVAGGRSITIPANAYFAHRVPPLGSTDFAVGAQPAFNADTFQILCAGRDEQFGTDDDLSNFWPGTRREYLDSLKD